MAGTTAIGGLASGLDTQGIVEQLIAVSKKRIDVVERNKTTEEEKLRAYRSFNTELLSFKSVAKSLSDEDSFDVFKSSTTTDSTNFKADELLAISVDSDASPGTHTIEFTSSSQLAQARQLSSASFSSSTTALSLSGEFIINGNSIIISATDTLVDIASTINAANSGTNATEVTASVLTVSSTDNRLILTSDKTGEDQFTLLDASATGTDILQSLGFSGSVTTIKNTTSDGAESDEFSNSGTSIESLLSLTTSQSSATVGIAGSNISIDLSTDTLTTIASTIDGVAGVSASVASTTTDGVTTYYIDISGTTTFTDYDNILETLGILETDYSDFNGKVKEIHTGSIANTTDAGVNPLVASKLFSDIDDVGTGLGTTDTITIRGTDSDGSAITETTFNIYSSGYKTLTNLIDAVSALYTNADVSLDAGKIVITDNTPGDSQISLTLIANNEGGGSLNFGAISATTEGYSMQTTAGQDAIIKIDGVTVTRSDNSIDDVINGVAINVSKIESGTTVNLTVSRNIDSIKSKINSFITSYNNIIEYINNQFKYNEEADEDEETTGALASESLLRSIKNSLQSTIINTVSLLPSGENALTLIGIHSDKFGKLSLKDSEFNTKINSDFNAVKRLFVAEGTTTNGEITYISHSDKTVAGEYDVVINTVATQATVTGTNDVSAGATDTITITDTSSTRVATVNYSASSIDDIVNAINSELDAERTQSIVGDQINYSGSPTKITSSTTFDSIDGTTISDGDIISFTGSTRLGGQISNSYTISDASTTTIQNFLSEIESSYGNTVSATINGSGYLVLTDNTLGDSQLSIDILEPASMGLDFGDFLTTNAGGVTGRHAIEITASKSGNFVVFTHDTYGSNQGFTISETDGDIGGVSGTVAGVDVTGTINGEAATGSGQVLTGDGPATDATTRIERLRLLVTSTTTGTKGNVKLTIGIAEQMYNFLNAYTNTVDGSLKYRMDSLDNIIDNLDDTIDGMMERLGKEQISLENKFVRLELALAKLKSMSNFLSMQLGILSR